MARKSTQNTMHKHKLTTLLLTTLSCIAAATAHAYVLEGVRLAPGDNNFYINLGAYSDDAMLALDQWNPYLGSTHLVGHEVSDHNFGLADERNEIYWSSDIGITMASNILAFTELRMDASGRYIDETDIVFNAAQNWASYSGPLVYWVPVYDVNRALLHEVGHSIGLGHSDYNTIMSPYIGNTWVLTADDIAGARAIYGTQQSVPDTGSTIALLGLGVGALALFRRK